MPQQPTKQKPNQTKKPQTTNQRMGQLRVKIGQWQFALCEWGKVIFRGLDTE